MKPGENLISTYGATSPFAEAYRHLRTNLLTRNNNGGRAAPRVIGIVAARPGLGASTTAANLAISLAEVAKRVLVVDADLRRPTQARLLGTKPEPGLADVLAGKVPAVKAIQPAAVAGVNVLAAGKAAPASFGLFETGIGGVIEELRSAFDYVIVDTPAAAVFPDALIAAPHLDGVILVARAEEARSGAFEEMRERLTHMHAVVLGVVLNNTRPDDSEGLRYYREYARAR